VIKVDEKDMAINMRDVAIALGLGEAIQVLYAQDHLYTFLLDCTKTILHDYLHNLEGNPEIPADDPLNIIALDDIELGLTEAAAKSPYVVRTGLQVDRLVRWTSDLADSAKNDMWQLCEDPGYYTEAYRSVADHDKCQVPDKSGRPHRAICTPEFVSNVLDKLVARYHRNLILWDQLDAYAKQIDHLFRQHPTGIDVGSLKLQDFLEALQCYGLMLQRTQEGLMIELEEFIASPKLRSRYQQFENAGHIEYRAVTDLKEPIKRALCNILEQLIGGPNGDAKLVPFVDLCQHVWEEIEEEVG
jgi:hypothetical protein